MANSKTLALLLLAAALVGLVQANLFGNHPVTSVKTQYGIVLGQFSAQNSHVVEFLGVPYAKPPVGALRFAPPQPFTDTWSQPFKAQTLSPVCPQTMLPTFQQSEDCLYLNVYRSDRVNSTQAMLPVVVWIHGGAFVGGSSHLFEGHHFVDDAKNPVILVSVQYRLGALGFLGTEQMKNEHNTTGNFGMLDQQRALEWVRDNIRQFGGDPSRVTIAGESAGAISVCMHMVAPQSRKLFSRAIMQSGMCRAASLEAKYSNSLQVVKRTPCVNATDQLACLRTLDVQTLLDATPAFGMSSQDKGQMAMPTIDGSFLLRDPETSFAQGDYHDVPMIVGANADEGTTFIYMFFKAPMPEAAYKLAIRMVYGADADKILKQYPAGTEYAKDARALLSKVVGDAEFLCPTMRVASYVRQAFAYLFAHSPECTYLIPREQYGAHHAAELQFVQGYQWFKELKNVTCNMTDAEYQLSDAMQSRWFNFAYRGNPNEPRQNLLWPLFDDDQKTAIKFDVPEISLVHKYEAKTCDFWQSLQSPANSLSANAEWGRRRRTLFDVSGSLSTLQNAAYAVSELS